jgi:hypothetical protein
MRANKNPLLEKPESEIYKQYQLFTSGDEEKMKEFLMNFQQGIWWKKY